MNTTDFYFQNTKNKTFENPTIPPYSLKNWPEELGLSLLVSPCCPVLSYSVYITIQFIIELGLHLGYFWKYALAWTASDPFFEKKVDLIVYFESVDRIATGNQFCFLKKKSIFGLEYL